MGQGLTKDPDEVEVNVVPTERKPRPLIDEREAIPQEEMETLYISAMKLALGGIEGFSQGELAQIGLGVVQWLAYQDGYPKRVYARIVSS